MHPQISILIITYNSKQIIDKLIKSIFKQSYSNFEIVVVDNASKDGCAEYIKTNYDSIKVIQSPKNLGYSGGVNLGIKFTEGKYIFIINDDICMHKEAIEQLKNNIESDYRIGAVQPKIKSYFKRNEFEYAGAAGGMLDTFGYPFCRGRIFDTVEEDKGQHDSQSRIFWASGAAFLVKKTAIERVGLFDENFGFYHEETDFCWRLHLAGFDITYEPAAIIYHRGGHATKKFFPNRQLINMHRNNWLMIIKNSNYKDLMIIIPIRFIFEFFSILYFINNGDHKHALAILKAIPEFLCKFKVIFRNRLKNRKILKNSSKIHKSIFYNRPIVIEYFLLKRHNYNEL